jgi:RimJ/RimL family protein N-acetyltransferase
MPRPLTERFDTARLLGEPISLEHFSDIHRLHTDPLVMQTLSADGKPLAEEATRKHLQRCSDHWDQHGFGLWVFRDGTDGQLIGRGGLRTYQLDGEEVVGFAVRPPEPGLRHGNIRESMVTSSEVLR